MSEENRKKEFNEKVKKRKEKYEEKQRMIRENVDNRAKLQDNIMVKRIENMRKFYDNPENEGKEYIDEYTYVMHPELKPDNYDEEDEDEFEKKMTNIITQDPEIEEEEKVKTVKRDYREKWRRLSHKKANEKIQRITSKNGKRKWRNPEWGRWYGQINYHNRWNKGNRDYIPKLPYIDEDIITKEGLQKNISSSNQGNEFYQYNRGFNELKIMPYSQTRSNYNWKQKLKNNNNYYVEQAKRLLPKKDFKKENIINNYYLRYAKEMLPIEWWEQEQIIPTKEEYWNGYYELQDKIRKKKRKYPKKKQINLEYKRNIKKKKIIPKKIDLKNREYRSDQYWGYNDLRFEDTKIEDIKSQDYYKEFDQRSNKIGEEQEITLSQDTSKKRKYRTQIFKNEVWCPILDQYISKKEKEKEQQFINKIVQSQKEKFRKNEPYLHPFGGFSQNVERNIKQEFTGLRKHIIEYMEKRDKMYETGIIHELPNPWQVTEEEIQQVKNEIKEIENQLISEPIKKQPRKIRKPITDSYEYMLHGEIYKNEIKKERRKRQNNIEQEIIDKGDWTIGEDDKIVPISKFTNYRIKKRIDSKGNTYNEDGNIIGNIFDPNYKKDEIIIPKIKKRKKNSKYPKPIQEEGETLEDFDIKRYKRQELKYKDCKDECEKQLKVDLGIIKLNYAKRTNSGFKVKKRDNKLAEQKFRNCIDNCYRKHMRPYQDWYKKDLNNKIDYHTAEWNLTNNYARKWNTLDL